MERDIMLEARPHLTCQIPEGICRSCLLKLPDDHLNNDCLVIFPFLNLCGDLRGLGS